MVVTCHVLVATCGDDQTELPDYRLLITDH